jgi:hypothetical protein
MKFCIRVPIRRSIFACLALVTVCALFLLTTVNVQASTVTINDQAGVLDSGRVQADAAQLPDPMLIYTTETFTGDQDALNQSTREQLPNQDSIAIGIDTVHRHLSIEAGTNVQLSDSQASDAVSAFRSNYDNGGDYTSATLAAIDSMQNALSEGGIDLFMRAVWCVLFLGGMAAILRFSKNHGGGAGFYHSQGWGQDFPRIQILTIEELLHGAVVKMPPQFGTFKQAQKAGKQAEAEQPELELG